MKSLFLRMFLWFCAANAVLVSALVLGYAVSDPDQIPFALPSVRKGTIVSAGRVAVAFYERGGQPELARYLQSLARDVGVRGSLYDSEAHELSGTASPPPIPREILDYPDGELMVRRIARTTGVRLRGASDGQQYTFVARLPRRQAWGFWSRTLIASFILTGAVLCFLLARQVTAPVLHLRSATARFSRGDLSARITLPAVLERKDEIGALAKDFNHMAARIETLVKSQQRLMADVSHELRSPITRLSLALGLMRRKRELDSGTALARMEREVERLNALIGQLLTLSRLESLDQPQPTEDVNLSALVREIAADADFEAANMNRSVRLIECAKCSVKGASDLLRSAVENVVRNALKYSSPNGQVQIRLLNGNRTATIVVEDEGPGVAPEALHHIFEPFYRIDEARDRRSGGAGLGLAITWQIVTLHGGSVRALNRNAGGLEMRITLPVSVA